MSKQRDDSKHSYKYIEEAQCQRALESPRTNGHTCTVTRIIGYGHKVRTPGDPSSRQYHRFLIYYNLYINILGIYCWKCRYNMMVINSEKFIFIIFHSDIVQCLNNSYLHYQYLFIHIFTVFRFYYNSKQGNKWNSTSFFFQLLDTKILRF